MKEALKISEIIALLNNIKDVHGDIKVGTWNDGILRFIRSIKYTEAVDSNDKVIDSAAVLQWWEENDDEED